MKQIFLDQEEVDKRENKTISKIRSYINDHVQQGDFTIEELSLVVGYKQESRLQSVLNSPFVSLNLLVIYKIAKALKVEVVSFFGVNCHFVNHSEARNFIVEKEFTFVSCIKEAVKKNEKYTMKTLSLALGYKNENQLSTFLSSTKSKGKGVRPLSLSVIFKISMLLEVDVKTFFKSDRG